jgi:threonine aldolase
MRRKDFIKLGGILASGMPQFGGIKANPASHHFNNSAQIDFLHDGLNLSPIEYAALLMKLADGGKIKADYYSNMGVVEEMENKFAKLLGKESAVFMPTGTLANHIGVRRLANQNRKVIVQEQSHLYNDSGDGTQTLSGLNLVPLGKQKVEFSLSDVEEIIASAKNGRVETRVGVISMETPVRRQFDRMINDDTLKSICDYAKLNGIKTHIDGARIFVQSVHTNITPADYGKMADTIYTSLWKCFNAASGAVLAGSKEFTANLFHERRMFGGGLPAAWPYAAIALHYADTFTDEYKPAWIKAEKLFSYLQKDERLKITKFENGSHIVRLSIKGINLSKFKEGLMKNNIELSNPDDKGFLLKINPSLNRTSPENVAELFKQALKISG